MSTSQSVRFGLVGYSKGGRRFHAPLIAGARDCVLAAVVTTSATRKLEVRSDHPQAVVFDDLASMLGSGAVDAVTISTPADSHVPLALQAIDAGTPVVVDKPFALDVAAATEAVLAATAKEVPLSVYQNRRWDADFLSLQAALATGRLGRLQRLESRIEQFAPAGGIPDSGGGILLDLGTHVVDQAILLAGPVTSVYCELDHLGNDPAAPVCRFFLALRHRDSVSHLVGDLALQGTPGTRFRAFGTEGTLGIPAFDGQADALVDGASADSDEWGVVPQEKWGTLHAGTRSAVWPSARGDWRSYYEQFAAAVRGQGPVPVDPQDSIDGLTVLEAAAHSARTGQPVAL